MFTVLSYCNTQEKKDQLLNLVTNLKIKFPEREILVYSHYQNLEPEYYKGANYYIFDFSNPIVDKLLYDWIYIYHQSKKFYRGGFDHGFAVIQMIKRSCLYLLNIGVNETTILNYDCSVEDLDNINMIEKHEDKIGSFSFWSPSGGDSLNPAISLTFMHLKISKMGREFFEDLTQEKYMSWGAKLIPEEIFVRILNENFKDRWSPITNKISSIISGASRELPTDHYLRNYFGTILPTRNNLDGNKDKCLAIWDCRSKIEKIDVYIDGNRYTLRNEVDGDYSNPSFFSHLPKGIKIERIELLSIDTEVIDPYIIDGLDEDYWRLNYHEPFSNS
jgi:hypothetical protein